MSLFLNRILVGARLASKRFLYPAGIGRLNRATSCTPTVPARRNHSEAYVPLCGTTFFRVVLISLALTIATPACAEELGRLFFTPEQRAQLDYDYAREAKPDHSDRALMLNGIVQKHGGKRTIWINGVPQQAGASDEKAPEISSVPLPGQSKSVKLKVGQRVLLSPTATPDTPKPDTSKPDTTKPDAPKP